MKLLISRGIMTRSLLCALLVLSQVCAISLPLQNRQEADARAGLKCKCYAEDGCWPSLKEWQALNASVDGLLQKVLPIAASCYNTFEGVSTYNAEKCAAVTAGWSSQLFV
jgi:hypothetical protein